MNKKIDFIKFSKRSKSNKTFSSNPDSENYEESEKSQKKKSKIKKKKSKSKKKKKNQSCKGITNIPNLPNLNLDIKLEEKNEIEFVLGEFNDFHSINEIQTFKNMTSLTLINESIKDISLITQNMPNPSIMKFLCLNQNEIDNLNGIEKLENIETIQMNFNYIDKIPAFFSSLKKLHTFWICDNNISILENIPINVKSFWIANNEIECIPENFDELVNLEILNISGNFIDDLKYLYILGKIKCLKRIYLSDINFGDNPICQFNNYRKIMVHIFNYVDIIDQIKLTNKEKLEVENYFNDDVIINNDKIKQNYKICKMIFRLMKTFKFFFSSFELYKIKELSLKLKKIEYNKYTKILFDNNIDIGETNKFNNEIELIRKKIKNSLSKCENIKNIFYQLKNKICDLNDLSIILNFYKLETNNNIEIEQGNLSTKWTTTCMNLMKFLLSEDFLKKNEIEGIFINQIYKIKNKKSSILFNALYDDLIEEYDKLGLDEKFFKYFFLILPDEITQDKRKLFHLLFGNHEEENFFFCDNYTYIDEFKMKKENDKYDESNSDNNEFKDYYTSIICKCSFFEDNIDVIDGRYNYFSSINEIKNYLINLKGNSNKDIICLKIKNNINVYYYTNKGLIYPKYIIEYNYNENEYSLNNEFNFKSSYENNLVFNEENENLFNICSKYMFNSKKNGINFINKDTLNKYYLSKFYEYKELENNFLFFIKNSLINYLNNCFKYKNKEEFFNEIKLLEEKINEINKYSIENSFLEQYDYWITNKGEDNSTNKHKGMNNDNNEVIKVIINNDNITESIKNKINFGNLKQINLFNQNLTDKSFNDLLSKIKNDSLNSKEILQMTEICEELLISKNNLITIELSQIFQIFPNIKTIDLSHNNISNIFYINKNTDIDNKSISILDISYNQIFDFKIIINLIKSFELSKFIYYANPFEKKYEKMIKYNINDKMNKDIKQSILTKYDNLTKNSEQMNAVLKIGEDIKIKNVTKLFDYIYNCYSFNDEYYSFNDCIYFRNNIKYDNETQINIAYLNNKNFLNIPTIEGNNNIQIIYLNSNKISKINNLSNFKNLKELFLQNNKIKIIENLPITIKKLDLSNNCISDLNGIEKLLNIEWINLENNNIKNISTLFKLTNLIEIYCANNIIDSFDDYSQFGKIKKLEILDISGNEIVHINNNLRFNIIYYCQNLKFLNRIIVNEKDKIISSEYFSGKLTLDILEKRMGEKCTSNNIMELDLSSLNLKDELELFSDKNYPKLKKINLSKNNFTSFIIFGTLPELIEINLSNNFFIELFSKKNKNNETNNFNIKNLLYLDMSVNQITNINGIQYFSKLRKLNISENSISRIDSLDKMNQLDYLNISSNKLRVCDKTNIGMLPSLKVLLCDNNYLKDINCFEKFYSIELLSFNNNKITNFESLERLNQLKNLSQLSIINNPITKTANYRKIIIYIFQNLRILDNKEICYEERIINVKNDNYSKDDDSFGLLNNNLNYNNNNNNNIHIINNNMPPQKVLKPRLNYVQIGYNLYPFKNNKFLSSSQRKYEMKKKKTRNKSNIQMNVNILKNKKNHNEYKWALFLSDRNKVTNYLFPSIRKSSTLAKKKKELSKVKFCLNSKYNVNGSVILVDKEKQNKIFHRPQSTARIPCPQHKSTHYKNMHPDYFSIVLNSVNNENNAAPIITLKNWNIKKINFDNKK